MLQGKPAKLSDKIIERVDEIYEKITWKELLRMVKDNLPLYSETEFKKVINELKNFKVDLEKYIPQRIYSYLSILMTGLKLKMAY